MATGGLDLTGRVAIVTGAGAGLGRAYALQLSRQGAAVLVNDPGMDRKSGRSVAETVVAEIRASGGKAAANTTFVTRDPKDAETIVQAAVDAFGRIDILVNNAGILQDVGFRKQTEEQWERVLAVHLYGQRNLCKAAWGRFVDQSYGRIVNVASINGVLGAFGQTNYSAAKSGIVGLSFALAKEGAKKNIKVNVLCPGAGTQMTATVMPKELVEAFKPEYVSPLVGFLCSDSPKLPSGRVLEAGSGWFGELQWRQAEGVFLDLDRGFGAADIEAHWEGITDMSRASFPDMGKETAQAVKRLPQPRSML